MPNSTHFHSQVLKYLRQYSQYCDLRHLQALSWMVSALICSGQLSLSAWEPYVPSRATKAQSVERRWQRFLSNARIRVERLYVPLRVGELEWMESAPLVLGNGHYGVMEPLLHDLPVRSLLWTGSAIVVASARARQCHGRFQGIQVAVAIRPMVVATSPGCHAPGRPWQCLLMS